MNKQEKKKILNKLSKESIQINAEGEKAFLEGLLSKKNYPDESHRSALLNSFIKKSTGLKIIQVSDTYLSMFIVTDKSYYVAEKFYRGEELTSWSAVEIYKDQKKNKISYNEVKDKALNHMLDNYFNKKEFLKRLRIDGIDFYCWQEVYE